MGNWNNRNDPEDLIHWFQVKPKRLPIIPSIINRQRLIKQDSLYLRMKIEWKINRKF